MLYFFFIVIISNYFSDIYKLGCVGDMYLYGECKYFFSDGYICVIVGMCLLLVGIGVIVLFF